MQFTKPIIFITGNSRSGTTLMSRILGNHRDVFTFQELHFFDELITTRNLTKKQTHEESIELFAKLTAIQRNGYFGNKDFSPFLDHAQNNISKGEILNGQDVYGKFLFKETGGSEKHIPCEQTPQNVFSIDSILNIFPSARIIIMVRDPREVLLSQKYKWKRRKFSGGKIPFKESIRARINYHPLTISNIWKSAMLHALQAENRNEVLVVRYEDLIAEPSKTIQQVCRHCNIDFDESMLDVPIVGSSNFNDTLKRGIDTSRTLQWKNGGLNDTEIEICQNVTGTLMKKYGYPEAKISGTLTRKLFYKISRPVKLVLAVFFNLHRLKNPLSALQKISGK